MLKEKKIGSVSFLLLYVCSFSVLSLQDLFAHQVGNLGGSLVVGVNAIALQLFAVVLEEGVEVEQFQLLFLGELL